jgi:hypothetical protein
MTLSVSADGADSSPGGGAGKPLKKQKKVLAI